MNVLVTGANGFIGRNLRAQLQTRPEITVLCFGSGNTRAELLDHLSVADVVVHLAGVNRPQDPAEFERVNAGLTTEICAILRQIGRRPKIVMASSIQASLDNPYGISKYHAEKALQSFAEETGTDVRIYRLKNIFGKWSQPNYNSVVATFCYCVAADLPLPVSDPSCEIQLSYIDDVVATFLSEILGQAGGTDSSSIPSYPITLGDLAGRIQSFHEMRSSLLTPDFQVRFNQNLYATYLSYVPDAARRHQLEINTDKRGSLAEFLKSQHFGQIFVSRTNPGVERGNHYHNTKTEKFLVVEGEGVVRMRHVEGTEIVEYPVSGTAFYVIDIPPGYTHSIRNTGSSEMVTLFWASEIFDPDRPDTYFLPVHQGAAGAV